MQSNLSLALDWIIKAEGGYVNNPADPGGETNFGITAKFLNTLSDYRLVAVKDLTEEQARAIYQKCFWDAMGCGTLPSGLDIAVFDCAVNQGSGRAKQFLSQCGNSALRFLKLRKDHYLGMNNAPEGMKEARNSEGQGASAEPRPYNPGRESPLRGFEKGWMNRLFDLAWLIRPLINN